MPTVIDQPIVGYAVNKQPTSQTPPPTTAPKRPKALPSYTYKIQPPDNHALYLTLSHDPNTLELQEIFINTKNPEHHQWIVALTRLISMTFRLSLPTATIISELRQIYSPTGGYYNEGKYHQSLVAEIGETVKLEYDRLHNNTPSNSYPPHATVCTACGEKAVITTDGCSTCLACGDSKCH